ncbi:nuclear transport factor 2 family protein [Streptomyces drozdowiczii]|uniref:Nuclear transport factor 2 family protein n=1 Tax=Streptomyces drozdowiczii TaxID=202862 RepID=A0ABY6PK57_9ACTN|nr:nuclear transport factor 2 family protein [Streptomyces drozdowiczii]MCX0241887.1 nuclear transport factor 2 family protein [Streptomyces drozdowiczii]UZK52718.1 nuclear transport factor 2 family protein [Streptomyces drozdowiczii]
MPETAESLVDKYAVAETCTRMAVHADRREWDQLRSLFADKVLLDYTSLNGGKPTRLTPKEIADAWAATFDRFDATQHLIANKLVELEADQATCTASFQATHRLATAQGTPLWILGGDYRWELTRVGARWLITSVKMTVTWSDGNQGLANAASTGRTEDRNVETVRTFLRLLEDKDIESWMRLWAEDADHHYPFGTAMFPAHLKGKEAIYDNWKGVPELFDTLSFPLREVWTDGPRNTVVARFDSDNVMKGGTGRYQNTYICVFTFDAEGRIREYREYFDPIVTALTYGLADVSYR